MVRPRMRMQSVDYYIETMDLVRKRSTEIG